MLFITCNHEVNINSQGKVHRLSTLLLKEYALVCFVVCLWSSLLVLVNYFYLVKGRTSVGHTYFALSLLTELIARKSAGGIEEGSKEIRELNMKV